jgi:hypothetical protein
MTILELQKELQEKYEKYGDIEVVMEDTDWIGIEIIGNVIDNPD